MRGLARRNSTALRSLRATAGLFATAMTGLLFLPWTAAAQQVTVVVTVQSDSGRVVAGTRLEVCRSQPRLRCWIERLDSTGRSRVTGVPEERLDFTARLDGWLGTRAGVHLRKDTTLVLSVRRPSLRLSGRVVDDSGRPVRTAVVTCSWRPDEGAVAATCGSTRSVLDGRFAFQVAPGIVGVDASEPWHQRAGQVTTVGRDTSLEIRLTRAASCAKEPGMVPVFPWPFGVSYGTPLGWTWSPTLMIELRRDACGTGDWIILGHDRGHGGRGYSLGWSFSRSRPLRAYKVMATWLRTNDKPLGALTATSYGGLELQHNWTLFGLRGGILWPLSSDGAKALLTWSVLLGM